jgi:hypothetical protein
MAVLTRPNAIFLSVVVTVHVLVGFPSWRPVKKLAWLAIPGGITLLMILPSSLSASRSSHAFDIIVPVGSPLWANSILSPGYSCNMPPQGTPIRKLYEPSGMLHELRKASFLWRFFELPDNENYYLFGLLSPVINYNPFTFRLIGPLALAGLIMALCEWRRFLLLLSAVGWLWFPLNLHLIQGRLRLVLFPLLCVFAAHAVRGLARALGGSPFGRAGQVEVGGSSLRSSAERRVPALVLGFALLVNLQDPSRYHGCWYADSTFGNHFHGKAQQCLNQARAVREPRQAAWLVRSAESHLRKMLLVSSVNYHVLAYQLLEEIARKIHNDPARAKEFAGRVDRLVRLITSLPPADHTGVVFTAPTYYFWPRSLNDPQPASLEYLERELDAARKSGSSR